MMPDYGTADIGQPLDCQTIPNWSAPYERPMFVAAPIRVTWAAPAEPFRFDRAAALNEYLVQLGDA